MGFFEDIEALVTQDPGHRGFAAIGGAQDIAGAVRLLEGTKRALIVTGFPITGANIGENDGPIGAAAIALACLRSGREAHILTDVYSDKIVSACLKALGAHSCPVHSLALDSQDAEKIAQAIAPDLIIAIERPGKAQDGHYHNQKGAVIDHMLADTDGLMALGVPTIAIGDGGNELGMGNYHDLTVEHIEGGALSAAVRKSDVALRSGVSNWWGWGIAALLSGISGTGCMTTRDQELACLEACIEAGAVDGVLKRAGLTVDGVELGGVDLVHGGLRQLIK